MQESFVILCWSSAVLRKLQPSGAQKAIDKLVQCQVRHLASSFMSVTQMPDTMSRLALADHGALLRFLIVITIVNLHAM